MTCAVVHLSRLTKRTRITFPRHVQFDVSNFQEALDAALAVSGRSTSEMNFCDLGSGGGRLVLAAAARHKWKCCLGVELLPALNDLAKQTYEAAMQLGEKRRAQLSEVRWICTARERFALHAHRLTLV